MIINNRGKNPDRITVMKLWVQSGGRCQFAGCNRRLYKDDLTWDEFNNSNVAHIVASSPDGPRGSECSYELSDKLDNLMLLCPICHKRIDNDPNKYTVDILRQMKTEQERKVQETLDSMNYPESEIVILESSIKGKISAHVDSELAADALRSVKKRPASKIPTIISLESTENYSSREYWNSLTKALEVAVQRKIVNALMLYPDIQFSIFPLAPIPLIAKLGEMLGDKHEISVFQKTRVPDTWRWQSNAKENSFDVTRTIDESGDPQRVAIVLSLTTELAPNRIKAIHNYGIVYSIRANHRGVNCISSQADLKDFWLSYQHVCDSVKNIDEVDVADVFPAVPVSAAFEIGHRYMPQVYPVLHIYDEDGDFFDALTIGDRE